MKSVARDVTVIAALVVAMVLGLAMQAQAANLGILLFDGVNLVTCDDNNPCDSNLATGAMAVNTASAPLGSATYSVTASITPGARDLFLQYDFAGPATGYVIALSSNNLTGSNLVWNGTFSGTQTSPDTTGFEFFADDANQRFVMTTLLCGGSLAGISFAGTCTTSPPFSDTSAVPGFSLTERLAISDLGSTAPSATGTFQFTTNAVGVPEPGTLLLLASGLAAAGVFGRGRTFRKREK
jgi:hypothetical protein